MQISEIPVEKIRAFANDIRASDRVKEHIKQLSDIEIIEQYNFSDGQFLTNLGVLWLGNSQQRSRIAYPVTVQYIVYDELQRKVRKENWHDYNLNPKELLFDIENKSAELKYFHEFPDGLFRKRVHHYDPRVVRELLINAIAHKSYTISGDIFIEVYTDRIEVTNPGRLPLGITKDNILHQKHRRNPHLMKVLHDLKLMEGEGSGYDLIYEIDSRDAKPFPEVISEYDYTKIIQESRVMDKESVYLLDYISRHFELTQREFIALGIISRNIKILSTQLAKQLQLSEEERMRYFTGRLTETAILVTQGTKKGTSYLVNPKLIHDSKLNIKPSLKTIEPHRLKALIEEDIKLYPGSSVRDVFERIKDIPFDEIQKLIYNMVDDNILDYKGGRTYRKYSVKKS